MTKSNWKKCRLSDIADVRDGTHDSPKEVTGYGFPLVTSRHICNGKIDLSNTYNISEKDYNDINLRSKVNLGDILISMIGTVGQIAYVNNTPQYAIKNIGLIKPNDLESSKYIFYYLQSPIAQEDILSRLKGTTQQYLSLGELRNFPITLPPLEEQKRIAEVLGAFDDKIELLQKQNKTLEEMAKAIFKSWFVDFDIVKAKQKGEKKEDIIKNYHLIEELYNLFPSSFVDSSLGPIPLGWQVKKLPEIATFLNGLALQKYPVKENEDFLPVIKIAELRNGVSSSTAKANIGVPTEYIIFNGDIIFSWSGSLMVKIWEGGKGALNQHLFKVSSEKYPKWFYYLWTSHYLPIFQEIALNKATTMGHIQRKHLDQALVVVPVNLAGFNNYFQYLIDKQILNNQQIQTLTELRDTLLPRLISGKIKV